MSSPGQKIIDAIIKGGLITAPVPFLLVWSPASAEQLDAVIAGLAPTVPAGAAFQSAWRAFAHELYAIGQASGFYDVPHTDPGFNHEQKLLLMVSEIIEGMEGTRGAPWPGIADDKLPHRPMLEVELADTVIRIMNYASHTGLDVAGAIAEKAAFNTTRPHRHGGKRF